MPVNAGSSSPCFFEALATVIVADAFAIDQATVLSAVAESSVASVASAQTVLVGSASETVAV